MGVKVPQPERQSIPRLIQPLRKVAMLLMLTAVLALTSSIIVPRQSQGNSPFTNPVGPHSTRFSPDGIRDAVLSELENDSLIGELVGPKYRIRIYAAYPEPRYTILSSEGTIEAVAITAAEVALQFPSLPLLTGSFHSENDSTNLPLLSDMPLDYQH